MRYLGLDLGMRTLGIAMSDITHTVANPYTILRFSEGDIYSTFEELKHIKDEYKIEKIVLGLPKNMNNTMGEKAILTMEFGERLSKELEIEVVYEDERLTTVLATNYMLEADLSRKKRKQKIDSLAASIILQSYLDKKRD